MIYSLIIFLLLLIWHNIDPVIITDMKRSVNEMKTW